jgi:putative ABC transport system permease protein
MIPIETISKPTAAATDPWWRRRSIKRASEAQGLTRFCCGLTATSGPGRDDNFSIFASEPSSVCGSGSPLAISNMAVGIVSVFMVVGGIVISEYYVGQVTERTHEIGIRKRWARGGPIFSAVSVESDCVSGTGG